MSADKPFPEGQGTVDSLLHACKVPCEFCFVPTHLLNISEDHSHAVVVLDFDVPHTFGVTWIVPWIEGAGKHP